MILSIYCQSEEGRRWDTRSMARGKIKTKTWPHLKAFFLMILSIYFSIWWWQEVGHKVDGKRENYRWVLLRAHAVQRLQRRDRYKMGINRKMQYSFPPFDPSLTWCYWAMLTLMAMETLQVLELEASRRPPPHPQCWEKFPKIPYLFSGRTLTLMMMVHLQVSELEGGRRLGNYLRRLPIFDF